MAAQWQDFLLQAKGETLLRNFKRISGKLQEDKEMAESFSDAE